VYYLLEYATDMDFFEHQEQARKRTVWLIVLYCSAIVLLIGAVYAAVAVCVASGDGNPVDPGIAICVVGGVLLLVLGGSWFKIAELSNGGGKLVAESLGGRQISPSSYQPAERRLYNVVEEMALAAGVPVPTIYILDNENSINAFAAGFSPREAVIGVNRGTVELLTRDELQGVIAHEFSHILNGDMRLNLRLIGILFGLQILAVVGYYAMRMSYYASMNSSRSRDNKGVGVTIALGLLGAGFGVMIIGYVGMFFSAIIKAAISRQREFLADASAVQFTRNPDGIAGALKKIGCPNVGSNVASPGAAETSHLFFGNVCSMFSLGNLFATHPDLTLRIQRIDPRFDGRFPQQIAPINFVEHQKETGTITPASLNHAALNNPLSLEKILAAGTLLNQIPQPVADAARNPLTAQATFYAIFLDDDAAVRQKQLNAIGNTFLLNETQKIYQQLQGIAEQAKIPLAQRVSSSLRQMTSAQYKQFSSVLDALIAADQKMTLFEYTLKAILFRDLDIYFGLAQPLAARYTTLPSVRQHVVCVLTFLAYSGHETQTDAQNAFQAAASQLGLGVPADWNVATIRQFDQSLRVLAETSPALKKQISDAFIHCIRFDGKITPREGELIRAIAAMLAIPMPEISL
jgi:Zn-dependent protease with chaperone function